MTHYITAIAGTFIAICELRKGPTEDDTMMAATYFRSRVHAWEISDEYAFIPVIGTGISGLTAYVDIYNPDTCPQDILGVGWTLEDRTLTAAENDVRALRAARLCYEAWCGNRSGL